jgi:putative toxin-antitoxin system antitoxin component (TIGR02293 family)
MNLNKRSLASQKNSLHTREKSEKTVRLRRVIDRASEVFGDKDKSIQWLINPNSSLDGHTPLSYLDTDVGAESVLDVLGRIEHGIFT